MLIRRHIARLAAAAMIAGLAMLPVAASAASPPVAGDSDTWVNVGEATAFFLDAYDDDGDPLTVITVTAPAHGTVHDCDDSGMCVYSPAGGYVGADTFRYRVSDGASTSAAATVTFHVSDPEAPSAYEQFAWAVSGQPTEIELAAFDTQGDAMTFSIVQPPGSGTLGPVGSPDCEAGSCTALVTFTPGSLGTVTFTFRATDSASHASVPATVTVEVEDPEAPVAYGNTVDVGTADTTTITLNGQEQLGNALTFAIGDQPTHGTLGPIATPECDGGFCTATVDYTADAYLGEDSFTFTVSTGTKTSAPATIELNVQTAPCQGRTVTNGTLLLGVNCRGELNVDNDGLKLVATGNDSTSPGCACEGWGVADQTSQVSGFANQSSGTSDNITIVSFERTPAAAVSVVDIGSTFRVTHDYHPSTQTPNAYEATVTITNTSPASTRLRYRRVMDWDIEPTAFSEFVTLQKGTSPSVVFTSDDGFATADPLAGPSDLGYTGSFTDAGPDDHGALFDFDFGALAAGGSKQFHIYYGGAATEADAVRALNAVNAEAYSLGQPSTPDGPTLGTPNTFLFGFNEIGGASVFAPTAVNDAATAPSGVATPIDVLANDTDPNGDPLTISASSDPPHGSVSCTPSSCSYTSDPGYSGTDSFTYTVSDGHGGHDTGHVTVTVTGAHPPVANNDSVSTAEDTPATIPVTANDTDVDGGPLAAVLATAPAHGTATCSTTSCTYTPAANYHGPDSFTYRATDGTLTSSPATVTITVTPVNDAPVAVPDSRTTPEDTPTTIPVTANDTDVDGGPLAAVLATAPAHGTATCSTTSCTYTPAANYHGPDSFTYRATDGSLNSTPVGVSITVTPVNDAPIAVDDNAETRAAPVTVAVTANDIDVDGDGLAASLPGAPGHGSATCSGGSCTYTPASGFAGSDSFTYVVSDGTTQDTGTVTVLVRSANSAPSGVDDVTTTTEDTAATLNVLANDTDADGDPLAVTGTSQPDGGSVTCSSSGSCTYAPDADFNGSDSFQYVVSDGQASDQVTVDVIVTPVNDTPGARPDSLTTKEDTSGTVSVLTNDTDADGDALSVTSRTNGSHGTVSCTASGSCRYTPATDYAGADSFTYTVSDGQGGRATAKVSVLVTPVADRPAAPRRVTASPGRKGGKKTLLVTWRDPASDGGSRITKHTVAVLKLKNGKVVQRRTFTFSGAANRAEVAVGSGTFKVKVAAVNAQGSGAYSTPTRLVASR